MIVTITSGFVATLAIITTSISVGISQGKSNKAALKAMEIQPAAQDTIAKVALLGSALIETASILAVFMSALLLLDTLEPCDLFYADLSKIGIGCALCIAGFTIGWASAQPAAQACFAIARQPFMSQKISNLMLITLSVIQTPLILAFIIALFIKAQAASSMYLADSLRLIASGIAIGLGSLGPAFGLSHFAATAIKGLGFNRAAYTPLLLFTFLSQAIIDAPIIFSLLISLGLLFKNVGPHNALYGINLLAAGLCIGFGTISCGISSGKIAASACDQIARTPENYTLISRASIFAQGIIDTMAIYALIISFLLIIVA